MTFAYPIVLLVPIIFLMVRGLRRRKESPVLFPSSSFLKDLKPTLRLKLRGPLLFILHTLFIVLLSVAAARPQKITFMEQSYAARNLMLTLDISGSMKEFDFRLHGRMVNRLEAVKYVVSQFTKGRLGDRIGLVAFGSHAFLQAPLTLDHDLLVHLVSLLQVGIAGDGTAIGDGLGVSLKRLRDVEAESKAVILLTDGVNNSGQVNPLQAAKVAKDLGIKIHTVGIGTRGTRSPRGIFQFGQTSEYDEKTLQQIAEISGGVFFNAQDLEGLERVYSEIDKLEQSSEDEPAKRIVDELYWNYAGYSLLALLAYLILANTIFSKIP